MKLLSLKTKNFRSFEGVNKENKIFCRNRINIIVGENNVGKSSLLRVLKIVSGQIIPTNVDIYKKEGNRELIIESELELNLNEMKDLISYITGNSKYLHNSENLIRFAEKLEPQII